MEESVFDEIIEDAISHGICVSNLVYSLAKELKLDDEECYELAIAGMIHDIGKIKLTSYLTHDDNSLHIEHMNYIRMHSQLSYEIAKEKGFSEYVQQTVLYHHENYDGSGYPENLSGDNIPLGSRILRVCDVFVALISDRSYRKAFPVETAIELIIDEVKNFDMNIFLAFQRVINEIDMEKLM